MTGKRDIAAKFKLLFISRDLFPPFRVDVSILFGDEIVGRGHQVDWLLQSGEKCDSAYKTSWKGSRVWVGPMDDGTSRFCRLKKRFLSFRHNFKMFNLVREHGYDFIQAKGVFISALPAIIASKLYGKKFIYWLSFPFPEADLYAARSKTARYPMLYLYRGLIFRFLLYKILLPASDHVFVQSEQMKRNIASKGICADKMTVIPMGVSLASIPYNRNRNSIKSNDTKSILYLGALNKERRIDFLIEVFSEVKKKVRNLKFYVVGGFEEPEDEQLLRNVAIQSGVSEDVVFTGFLPMENAWEFVADSDVCISFYNPTPILNTCSPTKLIEYMAMAKPVVGNEEQPEQASVLSDSGAGICVPSEVDAFADAIVTLLNDEGKAQEMGLRGRRYVEQHRTYKKIADLLEDEYLRIALKPENLTPERKPFHYENPIH